MIGTELEPPDPTRPRSAQTWRSSALDDGRRPASGLFFPHFLPPPTPCNHGRTRRCHRLGGACVLVAAHRSGAESNSFVRRRGRAKLWSGRDGTGRTDGRGEKCVVILTQSTAFGDKHGYFLRIL